MKLKIGININGKFYGINIKDKAKEAKTASLPEPQVIIRNHPVYEKYSEMFRAVVMDMTKAPDYMQINNRTNDDGSSILAYGGEDKVFVQPVEYIDETDKDNPLCRIITMKTVIVQTKKDNMA